MTPGPGMAGACFFDITVKGTGSHAAMPHQSKDPIVIGTALVQQLQTSSAATRRRPSRWCCRSPSSTRARPTTWCPTAATISGTVRYFHDEVIEMAETRIRELCAGFAQAYGIEIAVDIRNVFDVLMNDPDLSEAYVAAAIGHRGRETRRRHRPTR